MESDFASTDSGPVGTVSVDIVRSGNDAPQEPRQQTRAQTMSNRMSAENMELKKQNSDLMSKLEEEQSKSKA